MNKTLRWRRAIQASDLKPSTRLVLLNLSIYMNDEGKNCFPSTEQQTVDTGLTERTVITHIDNAVAAGFLKKGMKGRSGKGWARHEYEAVIPHGTEPLSVPKSDNAVQGAEPVSVAQDEGAERDNGMALKQVQSNSTWNSPVKEAEYFWQGGVIKLNEKDFRSWQVTAQVDEDTLAEYLEKRDTWLQTQSAGAQARWFISTARDIRNQFMKSSG